MNKISAFITGFSEVILSEPSLAKHDNVSVGYVVLRIVGQSFRTVLNCTVLHCTVPISNDNQQTVVNGARRLDYQPLFRVGTRPDPREQRKSRLVRSHNI